MIKLLSSIALGTALLSGEGGERQDIGLRLIASPSTLCASATQLKLEAIITNNTVEPVTISTNTVDARVDLVRLKSQVEPEVQHVLKDVDPAGWTRLTPNQPIILSFTESLTPDAMLMRPFSERPGTYELQTSFSVYAKNAAGTISSGGSVRSNRVIFLLSDCKTDPVLPRIEGGLVEHEGSGDVRGFNGR